MYDRLIYLEWKSFFRSANLGKSLGLKILMAFLAVYFALIFLLFGVGLYPLIEKYFPGEEVIGVANRFLLLWFLLEFGYRFFLQNLPILEIKPLLILPFKKRSLINFVLLKSLFSFFNFLPLLIFIPFGIFNLYNTELTAGSIFAWIVTLAGLSLCVNYLNFIFKKKFTDDLKALIPAVLIISILIFLDYSGKFYISHWFGWAVDQVLVFPVIAVIPFILLSLLFYWNRWQLEQRFYLDSGLKGRSKRTDNTQFLWTRRFGDLAPYLQQDLKMIWRNKRPKTAIYISFIFLAYGLIFYPQESYQSMPWFFVFVGIFMTGIFMINYGQFIPAWDANYYPLIMSQNIPMGRYLAAKAGLLTLSVIFLVILATPYLYFGWRIFALNLVCALYNIGVNIPILLYAGSFNRKRIDLDKSPFMNYQGTGAAQWLVGIPLMVIPVVLFWICYKLFSFQAGLALLFVLGFSGVLFRSYAIDFVAQVYKRNKYAMIEGFKQKGD